MNVNVVWYSKRVRGGETEQTVAVGVCCDALRWPVTSGSVERRPRPVLVCACCVFVCAVWVWRILADGEIDATAVQVLIATEL